MKGLNHPAQQNLYHEYLNRIDVRGVLDHYGAEACYDIMGADGTTEVVHRCLLDRVHTHHRNGDQNPSASANVEKRLYVCHVFGGMNFFHFIAQMEGIDNIAGVVPMVGRFLSESVRDVTSFVDELEKIFASSDFRQTDLPAYSDRVLLPWAFIHPYLATRGIDNDTASRLQIGWREDDNRITIPVFWEGHLRGWQARAVPASPDWPGTANPVPKYRSSPGFPKSDTLYYDHSAGRLRRGGQVIVVESPFSVIKHVALGVEVPAVATFGAKVSDRQVGLLAEFDHVIVWADPDPAGEMMTRRLVARLERRTRVSVVDPDDGMDLADYDTAESVMAKVEAATPAALVSY